MTDVSVIVCTYNRSSLLMGAIKSLSAQVVPQGLEWEIIIVDNNSKDDTREVIKEFISKSGMPIRYVVEERQGLSYARNRGITEAEGRYLAFIDDDALVGTNWVTAIYNAFQTYGCDCIGGRIYLEPVKRMPKWLGKELWGFLACLDYGDKPFQITTQYIFGTNMAFTRGILEKTGFFNVELGRRAYCPTGGEETELLQRILKLGGRAYYCPDAEVYHLVEDYKLKKKYFRGLHYYEGLNNGRNYDGEVRRHIYGIPSFIFPQFLRSIVNFLRNPNVRMQMNIWWFLGFMKGRVMRHKERHQCMEIKKTYSL